MSNSRFETLENGIVKLVLSPGLGARVVELSDKRTGRNWLTTGGNPEKTKNATVYGGLQSIGWDECFPSIAETPAPHPNRDHGDLWGREHEVRHVDNGIVSVFTHSEYVFRREIRLNRDTVEVQYCVNRPPLKTTPFPYMWSQHCLLATVPGEHITLAGLQAPRPAPPSELSDLVIQDITAKQAHKSYAKVDETAEVTVSGLNGGIHFCWSAADIPWCGIWLDNGGWPSDAPLHQVAIEPTTAPFEDPQSATRNGHGQTLQPGQTAKWAMQIKLSAS